MYKYDLSNSILNQIKDLCGLGHECTAGDIQHQVAHAAEEMLLSILPSDLHILEGLEALSRERGMSFEEILSEAIGQYFQEEAD